MKIYEHSKFLKLLKYHIYTIKRNTKRFLDQPIFCYTIWNIKSYKTVSLGVSLNFVNIAHGYPYTKTAETRE